MTQPKYTTDLTVLNNAESGTWTELASPYNAGGTPASDGENFIEGTDCRSQTTGTKSGLVFSIVFDNGSDHSGSMATDDCYFIWSFYAVGSNLDTYANGGMRVVIGTDTTNADAYAVGGSNFARNPYGGWMNVVVDPTLTADYTLGTGNAGAWRYIGTMPKTLAAISKGTPHAVDAISYGRGELIVEYGDATSGYCTFDELARANDANDISFTADTTNTDATLTNISPNTDNLYPGAPISGTGIPASTEIKSITNSTTAEMTANATATNTGVSITSQPYNRWGLFQRQFGTFLWKGLMSLGNATNAVDFRDSNRTIIIDDAAKTYAAFNKIVVTNASSRVDWTSCVFKALGTTSAGEFSVSNNADINIDGCTFIDMSTFTFGTSNSSCINSVFQGCGQITGTTGTFTNSKVLESTVAADTGAFVWNSATNPSTALTGMTFSKGTNAHHAIDFGTAVTGDITLTDCEFTGFGSTDDANDSTVRFLATTGSLTLSLVGCTVDGAAATTSNFSVDDAAGIVVTLSIDPVTLSINVNDNAGDDLQSARVYVEASDNTGDLPFRETVTSISRAGTTATVTHTAHGLVTGDYVNLSGITDKTEDNYGAFQVTRTDANTYTYQTTDSGSTSYTGTIKATGALINGTTDANGDISRSRTFGANQPIRGFIRKSSASPRFKTFDLSGNIVNSSTGLTLNVRLVKDE